MRHFARANWNEAIPGPRKDFRVDVDRQAPRAKRSPPVLLVRKRSVTGVMRLHHTEAWVRIGPVMSPKLLNTSVETVRVGNHRMTAS